MNWYTKLTIGVVALAAVTLPTGYFVQKKINREVPIYVKSHLEEIMKKQEEVLGIKHFGVPEISFDPAPSTKRENVFKAMPTIGEYDSKNDKIYLPLGLAITPEKNLTNSLAKFLTLGSTHNIKVTLDHELAHFYTDKVNEALGKGDWPEYYEISPNSTSPEEDKKRSKNDNLQIISEGIATYFERKLNIGFVKKPPIYEKGFRLVRPIIDKHGKKGIEYLITHTPSADKLTDLKTYQKAVLEKLSKD